MVAASSLLIGAWMGWYLQLSRRTVAGVMALGSGVMIATVAGEVVHDSVEHGGLLAVVIGLMIGALLFTGANLWLIGRGAAHRKRSGDQQHPAGENDQSAVAIALAAALDGIPESLVIGLSLVGGGHVGLPLLIAFLISNLPEGLSSAAGMRRARRSAVYTFGMWGGIVLASGMAGTVGYVAFAHAGPVTLAVINAIAAGAIIAMLVDTMVPEAVEGTHQMTGIFTVVGFVVAVAVGTYAG